MTAASSTPPSSPVREAARRRRWRFGAAMCPTCSPWTAPARKRPTMRTPSPSLHRGIFPPASSPKTRRRTCPALRRAGLGGFPPRTGGGVEALEIEGFPSPERSCAAFLGLRSTVFAVSVMGDEIFFPDPGLWTPGGHEPVRRTGHGSGREAAMRRSFCTITLAWAWKITSNNLKTKVCCQWNRLYPNRFHW